MLIKLNLQRFAPAIAFITINFDSHISKVTYSGVEWTASGQSQQTAIVDGSTGVFTVTLDSGHVLDTVTLGSDFDNTTLSTKTDTSFSLLFGNTAGGTITITSKKSTSQVSIDLTILSGWGNVTSGDHVIQVVAKADGYRDSEKSTAVNFTKGSGTATIPAGTYRFNETLNIPKGTDMEQNITGKMNTLTANNTYGAQKAFAIMYVAYLDDPTNPITTMQILDETADNFVIYTGGWEYNDGETGETYPVTDTTKLRTITIETDQQVSQEFKTWFDANTNVVTGHTLTFGEDLEVKVNGNAVTSPYVLTENCTITASNTNYSDIGATPPSVTVNNTAYNNSTTVAISGTDVDIENTNRSIGQQFPWGQITVTINYTA